MEVSSSHILRVFNDFLGNRLREVMEQVRGSLEQKLKAPFLRTHWSKVSSKVTFEVQKSPKFKTAKNASRNYGAHC